MSSKRKIKSVISMPMLDKRFNVDWLIPDRCFILDPNISYGFYKRLKETIKITY